MTRTPLPPLGIEQPCSVGNCNNPECVSARAAGHVSYGEYLDWSRYNLRLQPGDTLQVGDTIMPITDNITINLNQYVPRQYCYQCDGTFLNTETEECPLCTDIMCRSCLAEHHHTGPFCDACGFSALENEPISRCASCHQTYCYANQRYHRSCGGEYERRDDGRFSGRPPVVGYGREAMLSLLDAPYEPHPLAQGKRAVAFEIEAEYDGEDRAGTRLILPDTVGIDHDGSLSNGIEVTTPPARGAALVDVVTQTMQAMREGGYKAEESCGMHTHIDLRDRRSDTRFLAHLFNSFFAIEDVLYAMQTESRHMSTFSVPLRENFAFFDMYGQKSGDFDYTFYQQPKTLEGFEIMEIEKSRKYASPRYAAFNFHSVYYRGSLEVRLHEGCMNERDALMWAELLNAIIARVEQGHSYKMMQRLAQQSVTLDKVRAVARYFGLTPAMRSWIIGRINRGQGINFDLTDMIRWGVPVKGRPARHEPRRAHLNLRYVGQRVQCISCYHQWVLRARNYACPRCQRRLIDSWGSPMYSRIPRLSIRGRSSRSQRTFANLFTNIEETLNR